MTPEGRPPWGQPPDEADQHRHPGPGAEHDPEPWQDHLSMGLPRFGTPPNELWSSGLESPSQEREVPALHGDQPASAEPFDLDYSFEQSPKRGFDLPSTSATDEAHRGPGALPMPADSTQELSRIEFPASETFGSGGAVPPLPAPPSEPSVPAPAPMPPSGSMPSWGSPDVHPPPPVVQQPAWGSPSPPVNPAPPVSPAPPVDSWPPEAPSFHHPGTPAPGFYGLPVPEAGSEQSQPSAGSIDPPAVPPLQAATPASGYGSQPQATTPWHDGPSTGPPEPAPPGQSEPSLELTPLWGAPAQAPYQRPYAPSGDAPQTPGSLAEPAGAMGGSAPVEGISGPSWAHPAPAQSIAGNASPPMYPPAPAAAEPPPSAAESSTAAGFPYQSDDRTDGRADHGADEAAPSYSAEPTSVTWPASGLVPPPRLGAAGQRPPGFVPVTPAATGTDQGPAASGSFDERPRPEDVTTNLPTGVDWTWPVQASGEPTPGPSGVNQPDTTPGHHGGGWPAPSPADPPQVTTWPAPAADRQAEQHQSHQERPDLGAGPSWGVLDSRVPDDVTAAHDPGAGFDAGRPGWAVSIDPPAPDPHPVTSNGQDQDWRSQLDVQPTPRWTSARDVPDNPTPDVDPTPRPYQPARPAQPRGGGVARRPRRKRGCLLTLILVTFVVLLTAGAVWYVSRGSGYAVGDCVMRGADGGVLPTSCADDRAYRVVKRAGRPEQCRQPDATVTLERGDDVEVLCLKKVPKG